MTEDQIEHMVNRFLGWKLPSNFSPDAGISFKAAFNEHTAHPMRHEPTGTNLFDFTQATTMVRYMADGLVSADRQKCEKAGLNALSAKYPNDLIFSNAGFAIGVVNCVVDAVLKTQVPRVDAETESLRFELKTAKHEVSIADGEIDRISKALQEAERLRDEWCAEYTKLRDMRGVQ